MPEQKWEVISVPPFAAWANPSLSPSVAWNISPARDSRPAASLGSNSILMMIKKSWRINFTKTLLCFEKTFDEMLTSKLIPPRFSLSNFLIHSAAQQNRILNWNNFVIWRWPLPTQNQIGIPYVCIKCVQNLIEPFKCQLSRYRKFNEFIMRVRNTEGQEGITRNPMTMGYNGKRWNSDLLSGNVKQWHPLEFCSRHIFKLRLQKFLLRLKSLDFCNKKHLRFEPYIRKWKATLRRQFFLALQRLTREISRSEDVWKNTHRIGRTLQCTMSRQR